MTWAKFDDKFPRHPKVRPRTDAAFRLHVAGICYCAEHTTDGWIAADEADVLVAGWSKAKTRKAIDELIGAGLWEVVSGPEGQGYEVHDFLDYNPSREQVQAVRDGAKKRMKDHREKGRQGAMLTVVTP